MKCVDKIFQQLRAQQSVRELGKPGGRDDPLRRGLSGAGVRKYLRFLHEGISPEEARKKVLDDKEKRKEEQPPQTSKASPKKNPQGKRGSDFISPQQKKGEKKQRTGDDPRVMKTSKSANIAGQATSYAKAAKLIRIGVLPEDYPEATLTSEQLTDVEEAIVSEMINSTTKGLQFSGIHFRSGMILVDCESEQTAEWLAQMAPRLKEWKGPALVAKRGEDIPKAHTISLFLPRSKGQDTTALLKLIGVQNPEISTETWKVISAKGNGHGQVLSVGIDTKSADSIQAKGYTIHYRFGQIPVSGLRKQEKAKDKKIELDPSTSASTSSEPVANENTSTATKTQETEGMDLDLNVNPTTSAEENVISSEEEDRLLGPNVDHQGDGPDGPDKS
ncbi:uncharacterized protein LOC126736164 [Anthonomus grandis grandis]|uniref:uncharacterized protein LOC126736164 n=1 Tax=Anthonomus grandis grandis TaxID=2921223 RepID=UPI00216558AB|nr:uncharacterized protein LOC126736164 [Anthonomus grandis grandis]